MSFLEGKNLSKNWWKYDIYWLRKSSCFDLFENGKYDLFLSQKVDGKMLFTSYWKVLVLNFSAIVRSWCKDDIYWLTRSSCFELFGDGKYGFFSQKVDGKMMYTWSFWAFHDIPGSEKFDFSCNVLALKQNFTIFLLHQIKDSRYLSRHTLFFWPELSLVYSLKFLSVFFSQIISSLQ